MRRVLVAILAGLAVACQTTHLEDIQPGVAPALDSDEAGFWMSMENAEKDIATSGSRLENPALDAYLKSVVCRIASDYCSALRVYVMRQAGFNASMAPNGMMIVWSGLLIRVQNEAQLAAVLGHEAGHYQRRHTLSTFRNARNTTNALMAITVLSGGIVPAAVDTAWIIGIAALMQHSRAQEAEADDIGIHRIAAAGYDPREVAEIWTGLARESAVDEQVRNVGFFATHPTPESRLREMAARADALVTPENDRSTRAAEFDEVVAPLRPMLLGDEVAMRKHARSEVVIDRLVESELITQAQAAFYRGELYRVRGEEGDDALAIAQFRRAVATQSPEPVAFRNLGFALRRGGDRAGARDALQRYLELSPESNDRSMVEVYIQELTP